MNHGERPRIGVNMLGPYVEVPLPKGFGGLKRWFRSSRVEPEERLVLLRNWFRKRERLAIKVCSYTLQTTLLQLVQVFEELKSSGRLPNEISVSILRADLSRPLQIWDRRDSTENAYWKVVKRASDTGKRVCDLISKNYGADIELGLLRSDPCVKAIIVNDEHALFGLYVVRKHTKSGEPNLTVRDYVGYQTGLIELGRSRRNIGSVMFDELLGWFDQSWWASRRHVRSTVTPRRDW